MDVALITQACGTQADSDASLIHHLKHVAKALVGLTHEIADGAAFFTEIEYRGRGIAIAHLV
ncbi:hypothetical protein D3C84_1285120 [compost metagenome]